MGQKPITDEKVNPVGTGHAQLALGVLLLLVGIVVGPHVLRRARAVYLEHEFPDVLYEPAEELGVGSPEDFAVGEVDERFKASAVWIVREKEGFYALSTICTRLGCTPNWLATEQELVCPCCESKFLKTGINVAGPAPRPLERFKIVMGEDGQIVIDRGVKYQHEKGEWEMDGAFLVYP